MTMTSLLCSLLRELPRPLLLTTGVVIGMLAVWLWAQGA